MIEIEVVYVKNLNWSLLQLGLPLVLKFRVKAQGQTRTPTLVFSIGSFLKRVPYKPPENDERDLSGDLRSKLSLSNFSVQNAWQIETTPRSEALVIEFSNGERVDLPLEVSPPTYWHRCLPMPGFGGRSIPCHHATILLTPTWQQPTIRIRDEGVPPENLPILPIELAVAALIDPNDPETRQGAAPGTIGHRIDDILKIAAGLRAESTSAPSEVLAAFNMAFRERSTPVAEFLVEFEPAQQAVRLLTKDRERGAVCLDIAVLASEALEARRARPLFILTNGGRHSVAGVWADAQSKFHEAKQLCLDPIEIGRLVAEGKLLVCDPRGSTGEITKETSTLAWKTLGEGFVHAVDVSACRQKVKPLERPFAHGTHWVRPYLDSLDILVGLKATPKAEANLAPSESGTELLDDPVGVFVAMRCRPEGRPDTVAVLDSQSGPGWLTQKLVERQGFVALLGDGGAGKTYLTRRFASELIARRRERGDEAPLPLFFPLRYLSPADRLDEAVARWLGFSGAEVLKSMANSTRLVVLLDALDEASRRYTAREDFDKLFAPIRDLPNCSVLLTARSAIFPGNPDQFLSGFQIANLQKWSADDLFRFLVQCEGKDVVFRNGVGKFHEKLTRNTNLRDLTQTPLFARMLVETRDYIETDGDVRDEIDLYRRYAMTCFRRRPKEISNMTPDRAAGATAETALVMYLLGKDAVPAEKLATDLDTHLHGDGIDVYREFVARDVLVHGVLAPEPSLRDEHAFRFTHISLQHYFLAERLYESLSRSLSTQLLPQLFGQAVLPQPVLGFMASILKQASPAPWRRTAVARNGLVAALELVIRSPFEERPIRIDMTGRSVSEMDPSRAFRNAIMLHLTAGGTLEDADLRDLVLTNADFTGARLCRSNLSNSHLEGAILRDANLAGCDLSGATLVEVDVTATNFASATFAGAELKRLRIGHPGTFPRICGAIGFESVYFDAGSIDALKVLLRCIPDCEEDATYSVWARSVRDVLSAALARLVSED